jgi:hypothetical protein
MEEVIPLVVVQLPDSETDNTPMRTFTQTIDVRVGNVPLQVGPARTVCFVKGLCVTGCVNNTRRPLSLYIDVPGTFSSILSIPTKPDSGAFFTHYLIPPMSESKSVCQRYLPCRTDDLQALGTMRDDDEVCVPCNTRIAPHGPIQTSACFQLVFPEITETMCDGLSYMSEKSFKQCVARVGYTDISTVTWKVYTFDGSELDEGENGSLQITFAAHVM